MLGPAHMDSWAATGFEGWHNRLAQPQDRYDDLGDSVVGTIRDTIVI